MSFRWLVVASALLLASCMGRIEDPVGPGAGPKGGPSGPNSPSTTVDPPPPPSACEPAAVPASAPIVRALTPSQYTNAVRDLVGDPGFTPTFDDTTDPLTARGVRQLRNDAELVLERRGEWMASVIPCDPTGPVDDACADSVIDDLGRRAYRRPLTDAERDALKAVYTSARDTLSFEDAVAVVVQVILQSPGFLYLNEPVNADGTVRRLDDYEIATRLSLFIWNTIPDDQLLDAAANGELTGGGLRLQAERLLASPRATPMVQGFFSEWLRLDGDALHDSLEASEKDAERFPAYDAELQSAMRTEIEHLVTDVVDNGGTLADLLTTRRAHVDADLAALYGVEGPAEGEGFMDVELPADQRAGLLTRAGFLTVYSSQQVQSPIRRGVFVLEDVLCYALGEPPPNANDVPVTGGQVENGAVRSVRQDVEARTGGGGTCVACHSVINPTGFPFEHYDAIGTWRDTELGTNLPIDSSGELRFSGVDGPVADAIELSERLATSQTVRTCFEKRWMSQALHLPISELDRCAVERVGASLDEATSIRDVILAVVESGAFSHVAATEEE